MVPDIEIERDQWKPIEINLERQSMFFDFAVDYTSKNPDVSRDFTVDNEVFQEFKRFCKDQEFTYKSKLQSKLEDFEETVKEQDKEELFQDDIEKLKQMVEAEKEKDFEESREWIERSVKREIIRKLFGEKGVYEEMVLKTDPYVRKAIEILTEQKEYSKILQPIDKSDS